MRYAVRTFVNKTPLTMLVSMVQSLFDELPDHGIRPLQTSKREGIRTSVSVLKSRKRITLNFYRII